jgi:hypothetical protein
VDCQTCPAQGSKEYKSLCSAASNIINNNGMNNNKDICSLRGQELCPNAKCIPGQPHHCECNAGYKMSSANDKCIDIDECQIGLCRNGRCQNKDGSFECQCPSGFHLSADGKECTDYNECEQVSR